MTLKRVTASYTAEVRTKCGSGINYVGQLPADVQPLQLPHPLPTPILPVHAPTTPMQLR